MQSDIFIRKLKTIIKKPKSVLIKALYFLSPWLTDKLYLELLFPLKTGYKLDLKNPQTYNEKLQWLKLYYRDPLLPKLVDKYEYKQYVKKKVGEEYVVKNYGIWDSFDEIEFDKLPNQFVLKTTHDQGGVVICEGKSNFDIEQAKNKINKHLKENLYFRFREWPYKYVKPRIIAEELLVDDSGVELKDYKFYCFDGVPKAVLVVSERASDNPNYDFYDMELNNLPFSQGGDRGSKDFKKPKNFGCMPKITKEISGGFPHVRIDLYNINGQIFFGEFTFFDSAGLSPFQPIKWDYEFGDYLELPERNN
jgi:hypothetical protein